MFAMEYSSRINDDIDDGTIEGLPKSVRDPEVFYDSYSTRKWMSDIAGKDFNNKPLAKEKDFFGSRQIVDCVHRNSHFPTNNTSLFHVIKRRTVTKTLHTPTACTHTNIHVTQDIETETSMNIQSVTS